MRSLLFGLAVATAAVVSADESWTCPQSGKQFLTGALPATEAELSQAPIYSPPGRPPKHVAYIPHVRSMFGNDRYGVCVTSEEAFAKSCWVAGVQPEIDIPEPVVIDWARRRGVLHGANLGHVADLMVKEGFRVDRQLYNDGPKLLVDFRDEPVLKAAIATGPVKVAIAARTLPGGAGSRDGWHVTGGSARGSDHCVSLCGYGRADWLYGELGVPLPAELSADTEGFLCYTWSTIGFVDFAWVRGCVKEAWIRTPTTIGIPPIHPPLLPYFSPILVLRRLGVLLLVVILGIALGLLGRYLFRRWSPIQPPRQQRLPFSGTGEP